MSPLITLQYLVGNGAEVLVQSSVPVAGVIFHRLQFDFFLIDCKQTQTHTRLLTHTHIL